MKRSEQQNPVHGELLILAKIDPVSSLAIVSDTRDIEIDENGIAKLGHIWLISSSNQNSEYQIINELRIQVY